MPLATQHPTLVPTVPRASLIGTATRALFLALAWIAASAAQAQTTVPADLGPSLEYEELLVLADAAPAVTAAQLALAQAERQAAARGMPITLTGSAGYGASSGELDPGGGLPAEDVGDGDAAPLVVGVRVDPFVLGSGADELDRARAAVDAARDDLDAARRRSRIDALAAYQDALAAARSLALADAERELAQRELAAARAAVDAGAASDLRLAEADLAVTRAEQSVGAARRQADLAQRALAVTVGRDVPPPAASLPEPPALPARDALSPAARTDVRAAERAVDDADRAADAAVRDVLPTLTLDASWIQGDDASTLRLGGSIDSTALAPSLQLSYDPDDGVQGVLADDGRLSRFDVTVRLDVVFSPAVGDALAAVRLGQEQARSRLGSAYDAAELALDRAWLAALDASERVELARDARTLAARSADVARARVEAGAAAPVTAARAELDVRRADADLATATEAYRLALFRLLDAAAVPPEDPE